MNVGDIVETTHHGRVEIASLSCATGLKDCPGIAAYRLGITGLIRRGGTICIPPRSIISAEVARFEVGKYYAVRSLGDWDCIYRFLVTGRTDKTVLINETHHGARPQRRRVKIIDGSETFAPYGSYSLSPTVWASSGDIEENA